MSWRLPATVVLLLYLSLISLSLHPVFSRPAEPTATSLLPTLATLATLPTHEHTHHDTTTLPVPPLTTPSAQPNQVAECTAKATRGATTFGRDC